EAQQRSGRIDLAARKAGACECATFRAQCHVERTAVSRYERRIRAPDSFENRDMRGRSRNIVSVLIGQARPAVPPLPRRLAVHVCGRPRSCQARYVFPILEHGKILWKSEVHTARCAANEQRFNGDATRVEERPVKIPRVNCEVGADGGRTGEIAEADGWPKIPIPRWFASKPFADSIVPLAPIF